MRQKEIRDIIEPKDMIVGAANAPITLVEFGDYESEACAQANEVVKEILEDYDGKVRFIFRHFPLTRIHQKALKAAEAAVAAGQEGKFWDMHQVLFANRRQLGTISLKLYAREAGVTNKRFLDELINGVYGWQVQGDVSDGRQMGVTDIPAFFINGMPFGEEPTRKNLRRALDEMLGEDGNKQNGPKKAEKVRA